MTEPFKMQLSADDWTRGEDVLLSMGSGQRVFVVGDLFRASVVLIERAERILVIGRTWRQVMAGQIEGVPADTLQHVEENEVGGHKAEAKALSLTDPGHAALQRPELPAAVPYGASIGAVRALYNNSRLAAGEGFPQSPQLGAAPVFWLIGVVGVAAIAGGTWYGIDRNAKRAEVDKHTATMMAEVDRYTRELEMKIAAGLPLPSPPKLIERVAAAENGSGIWIGLTAAAAGAVVALAAKEALTKPPRRSNPRRARPQRTTRRRRPGNIHVKRARKTRKRRGTGTSGASSPKRGRGTAPRRRNPRAQSGAPMASARKRGDGGFDLMIDRKPSGWRLYYDRSRKGYDPWVVFRGTAGRDALSRKTTRPFQEYATKADAQIGAYHKLVTIPALDRKANPARTQADLLRELREDGPGTDVRLTLEADQKIARALERKGQLVIVDERGDPRNGAVYMVVRLPTKKTSARTSKPTRKTSTKKKAAPKKAAKKTTRRTSSTTTTTRRKTKAGTTTRKVITTRSNPRKRRRNPLKSGYSAATVRANVAQLRKEGYSEGMAAAIALKMARAEYRKKHAAGGFPGHLQTKAERKGHTRPKARRAAKTKAKRRAPAGRRTGERSGSKSAKASGASKRRKPSAKRSSPKRAKRKPTKSKR